MLHPSKILHLRCRDFDGVATRIIILEDCSSYIS